MEESLLLVACILALEALYLQLEVDGILASQECKLGL